MVGTILALVNGQLKLAGLFVESSQRVDIKIYLTIDCEQGTGNKEGVQVGENIPVHIMVGMIIMVAWKLMMVIRIQKIVMVLTIIMLVLDSWNTLQLAQSHIADSLQYENRHCDIKYI